MPADATYLAECERIVQFAPVSIMTQEEMAGTILDLRV